MGKYSVSLKKVVEDNSLGILYAPKPVEDVYVTSQDVNRPGLMLAGYSAYFDAERIQFLGLAEMNYISSLDEDAAAASMERLMATEPVAVVITRSLECPDKLREYAQKYSVPILTSPDSTSGCMSTLISYLGVELAQRITRHGVLVEVSGEGVLILGDSGVGIINARRIFGMGAVKMTEKIDMVVQLEPWDNEKVYDRLGLDNEYVEILGINIPLTVVPVKPGRNLSIIIEAAAMNNRQKKMGYNAARELLHSLGMTDDIVPEKKELEVWHDF